MCNIPENLATVKVVGRGISGRPSRPARTATAVHRLELVGSAVSLPQTAERG